MKKKKVPVACNLNDYITFKPTPEAAEIYNRYYLDINAFVPRFQSLIKKDGTVKLQMFEFMKIFGSHFNYGGNLPIQDMNVSIEATICPLTLELLK